MSKRGFTIVELVIVIAVIAILAAVMIPTFSGIVKRANISADIQTVRNMNAILVGNKPTNAGEAVAMLKANGFERLHPKTKFYRFYWIQSINTVVLTNEGISPVFPEELADKVFDPDDWFDLTYAYAAITETEKAPDIDVPIEPIEPPVDPTPPVEEETEETASHPEYVSVTFTCNKPEYLKAMPANTTVKYGETFQCQLELAEGGQYWITTITIYKDGKQHLTKYPKPDSSFGYADTNMTEDVEINIHVVKYCTVTFKAEGAVLKDSGYTKTGITVEYGIGALFEEKDLKKYFIPDGYEIVTITAQVPYNVYDPEKQILHLQRITENIEVTFVLQPK